MRRPEMATALRALTVKCHAPERFHTVWNVCETNVPLSYAHYAPGMVWRDQDPPATDVLLDINVPYSGAGSPAYLEIDKLPLAHRSRGHDDSSPALSPRRQSSGHFSFAG